MSYNVSLYRIETKAKEQQMGSKDFFDDENNFEPFTQQQIAYLRNRLLKYNYIQQQQDKLGEHFYNSAEETSALLTSRGLFFTAGWNEGAIFEIGMTASEFTDTDEFAKYNPQNKGWEE
ncbi:hypothetical protein [Bacteroides sp. 519]|uniref:hypothetical protein n=1 Tax=Bacteroides sp. 519 TaxID=2302937 RepID=UPI0013D5ACE7|nr:hypothetical protein [Bacteroides sp. 519]NDV60545.1 hypothetical protein [Bacteroides sp. 519]